MKNKASNTPAPEPSPAPQGLSPALKTVKKRFVILTLSVGLGMALLNSFGLQTVFAYFIEGNVAFSSIETIVQALIAFLHIAALFFGYAVMVYATFLFGRTESRLFFFLDLIQVAASSLASLGASFFSTTPELFLYNLPSMLLYLLINMGVYLLLLGAVRLTSLFIRRRSIQKGNDDIALRGQFFSKKHPLLLTILLTTCIYIASALFLAIYDTCRDFYLYGLPVNMNELVYLVTPYVEAAAYFFIGYTVSLSALNLLQGMVRKVMQSEEA